jgi:hypothetical protein
MPEGRHQLRDTPPPNTKKPDRNHKKPLMNRIIALLFAVLLMAASACGSRSGDPSAETEPRAGTETEAVADTLVVEMDQLQEEIEQAADELESLLNELE